MARVESVLFELPAYHSPEQYARLTALSESLTAPPPIDELYDIIEQFAIHGMVDAFRNLGEVCAGVLGKSRAARGYMAQYAGYLEGCARTLGPDFADRRNLDLLVPYPQRVIRDTPSRRLVIVVPTYYNNVMISLPMLDLFLDHHGVDALHLKATHAALPYYSGFYGIGSNGNRVAERLKADIATWGYEEVSVVGASSGGFFALWLGAELGAASVVTFGADIRPTTRSRLNTPEDLARMVTEEDIADLVDLSQVGRIHAYAGGNRHRDVECLTYLEGYDNVTARMIAGGGHLVLLDLIREGYAFTDLVE